MIHVHSTHKKDNTPNLQTRNSIAVRSNQPSYGVRFMIPKSFVETLDRRDVRIDSTGLFPDRYWALSWNSERLLAGAMCLTVG